MNISMELGKRIRFARKKKGLSQEALAIKLGKTTSAVGQYEIGKSLPGIEVLIKISEICEVSIEWLTKGNNESEYELDSFSSKPKDNGEFGSEVERLLRENQELRREKAEMSNQINALLRILEKAGLGKLKVAVQQAGALLANPAPVTQASYVMQ